MKLIIFAPHPPGNASSHHRVYQYIPHLEKAGIECTVRPFYSKELFKMLYQSGKVFKKGLLFLWCLLRRAYHALTAYRYDAVFIHREINPLRGKCLEWLLIRINPRVIFDFDDAIYLPVQHVKRFGLILKDPKKAYLWMKKARVVIAGNRHLAEVARKYNSDVEILPTPVDLERYKLEEKGAQDSLTIGWIGTQDNLRYLERIIPALRELAKRHRFRFLIFSGASIDVPEVNIEHVKWSNHIEPKVLRCFDIGVYPLPDDQWTRGKCAFKGLLYLANGIPGVYSRLPAIEEIIKQGLNGFIASETKEWIEYLEILIQDEQLRTTMGNIARQTFPNAFELRYCAETLIKNLNKITRS